VMLVRERHRLVLRHRDVRDERPLVDSICGPKNSTRCEETPDDTDLGQAVRAAVEYLRHRLGAFRSGPASENAEGRSRQLN
jgi:hypothetical protein